MAKNNSKARRCEIEIGTHLIEVFEIPPDQSGVYVLSDSQAEQAIEEYSGSFRDFRRSKSPYALPHKGFRLEKLTIDDNNTKINAAPPELVTAYWGDRASKGNAIAVLLLVACAAETIDRRADKAFGKTRSEEEYQERAKTRCGGKIVRRGFTDAIKTYLERHNDLSENRVKFMYSNASNAVNRAIFGRVAKQLCKDFKVPDSDLLRDSFNAIELRHIQEVEDLAMRLVDQQDIDPVEAVKEAQSRLLIPVSDRVPA